MIGVGGHLRRIVIKLSAIGGKPRQIGGGVILGFNPMVGVKKIWRRLIGAGQLADHIGRRPIGGAAERKSLDGRLGLLGVENNLQVQQIRAVQLARVDGP